MSHKLGILLWFGTVVLVTGILMFILTQPTPKPKWENKDKSFYIEDSILEPKIFERGSMLWDSTDILKPELDSLIRNVKFESGKGITIRKACKCNCHD